MVTNRSVPISSGSVLQLLARVVCFIMVIGCTTTVSAQINVALNKTVTASSIVGATPAANLTDGNTGTAAGTSNTATLPNAEWFQIDLGADYIIENVRITPRTGQHDRGRRFIIVTWPSVLGATSLGADPNTYVGSGAAVSAYNRLIYSNPATITSGAPLGGTSPGTAGTNLGPDYTTLNLNMGIHVARYIRILTLQDDFLDLAEVEVFTSTAVPLRNFVNGGFEQGSAVLSGVNNVHEADVEGWSTTEAVAMATAVSNIDPTNGGFIEFWRDGTNGVPANEGNYFVELNAFTNGSLSQAPLCVLPGESFTWSFAHRGRNGVDVMRLVINDADVAEFSDNNAVAGTHTGTVLDAATTTITSTVPEANGWTQYTGTWTNTTGVSQTVIFAFRAVSSAGGSNSLGNFLDDVSLIPLTTLVSFNAATASGPETTSTASLPPLFVNGTVPAGATVQINITGGTATRGTDYTTSVPGIITVPIPAGVYDGTAATGISLAPYIQISTDLVSPESTETIVMQLQNPVNVSIPGTLSCVAGANGHTYSILDVPFATVSGNIFTDANGLSNSLIDGIPYTGAQLYVNIVDANGLIVAAVPVNTITGAYAAPNIFYGNYTIQVSTTQGTVGNTPPSVTLPAGWVNTGDGTGTGDGTPDGFTPVAIGSPVVTVNFGIQQRPTAAPATTTIPVPSIGDKIALTGTGGNPPVPSGTDPEDGTLGAGNTIVITTLPANTTLLYNNVAVTAGQVITGFDPALLQVEITTASIGTTGTTFSFSFSDAAGITSAPVTYTLDWVSFLPVTLANFNARVKAQDVIVSWQTAQEHNNDRFEIWYSTDGTLFRKAGEVKGAGNSNSILAYEFLHTNAGLQNTAILYYQLKQVDKDGRSVNSKIISISLQAQQSIGLYPNPVQKGKLLTVTVPQIREISVFSITGQRIWWNTYDSNSSTISIPTRHLQKGTYMLYVNGKQLSKRFVVIE